VHVLGLTGSHTCLLQPFVDVINRVIRILHETNVKPLGICHLVRTVEIADSKHETSVSVDTSLASVGSGYGRHWKKRWNSHAVPRTPKSIGRYASGKGRGWQPQARLEVNESVPAEARPVLGVIAVAPVQ
jgi:hypothetical protein